MPSQFITIANNASETKKIAKNLAEEILADGKRREGAIVLGLKGNLGGGKTTFTQGFAKGLRIKEKILSPTFNILKKFKIPNSEFENFYHFDCYRIEKAKEVLALGFEEIIFNPENVVVVEWPENIKGIIPKKTIWICFKVLGGNKRQLTINCKL